jgi:hypothetical protein
MYQEILSISSEITSAYGSHAPRGPAQGLSSVPNHRAIQAAFHAEHGNDEPGVRKIIFNQILSVTAKV